MERSAPGPSLVLTVSWLTWPLAPPAQHSPRAQKFSSARPAPPFRAPPPRQILCGSVARLPTLLVPGGPEPPPWASASASIRQRFKPFALRCARRQTDCDLEWIWRCLLSAWKVPQPVASSCCSPSPWCTQTQTNTNSVRPHKQSKSSPPSARQELRAQRQKGEQETPQPDREEGSRGFQPIRTRVPCLQARAACGSVGAMNQWAMTYLDRENLPLRTVPAHQAIGREALSRPLAQKHRPPPCCLLHLRRLPRCLPGYRDHYCRPAATIVIGLHTSMYNMQGRQGRPCRAVQDSDIKSPYCFLRAYA